MRRSGIVEQLTVVIVLLGLARPANVQPSADPRQQARLLWASGNQMGGVHHATAYDDRTNALLRSRLLSENTLRPPEGGGILPAHHGTMENAMAKFVHFETDRGEIVAELFDGDAPGTVENFAGLAAGTKEWTDPRSGQKVTRPYYDGLTFHRVIPNFVIQGGCPLGTGTGGPGYRITCEIAGNPRKHQRGSLSMAHAGKDTGGSQFFICHSGQAHLDGKHTVFGQVTQGIEAVDAIRAGDKMNRVWIEER